MTQNAREISKALFCVTFALFPVLVGCGLHPGPLPQTQQPARDSRWNIEDRMLQHRFRTVVARLATSAVVDGYGRHIATGELDLLNMNAPAVTILSKVPGVVSVAGSSVDHPSSRIIHLVSHPIPSRDDFLNALRHTADGGVSESQNHQLYNEYLAQIRLSKITDVVIARCLSEHHNLRRIYLQGMPCNYVLSPDSRGAVLDAAARNESHQSSKVSMSAAWGELLEVSAADLGRLSDWSVLSVPNPDARSGNLLPRIKTINGVDKLLYEQSRKAVQFDLEFMLSNGSCWLFLADDSLLLEDEIRSRHPTCEYIRVSSDWWFRTSPLDPNVWAR